MIQNPHLKYFKWSWFRRFDPSVEINENISMWLQHLFIVLNFALAQQGKNYKIHRPHPLKIVLRVEKITAAECTNSHIRTSSDKTALSSE